MTDTVTNWPTGQEQELSLKDALRSLLNRMGGTAQYFHAMCVSDAVRVHSIATPHKGLTWRTCPAMACRDVQKVVAEFEPLATPANHNPYALRNWRRRWAHNSQSLESYLKEEKKRGRT